MVAADLVVS